VLSKNAADCVGWATESDDLLELVSQDRDVVSVRARRRLLRGHHCWLVRLLAHNAHLVVSVIVVVPDFTTRNRVSNGEKEGLLLGAREDVCKLDREHKAVNHPVIERLLVASSDFRGGLPFVKGEAHGNPFFEREIAHANNTFNCGPD